MHSIPKCGFLTVAFGCKKKKKCLIKCYFVYLLLIWVLKCLVMKKKIQKKTKKRQENKDWTWIGRGEHKDHEHVLLKN